MMFPPSAGAGPERIRLFCSSWKHKTPGASQAVCFWYISCQNGFGFDKNDAFFCTNTQSDSAWQEHAQKVGRDFILHSGILFYTFSGPTVVGTDLCVCFWAAEVWQHQHTNPALLGEQKLQEQPDLVKEKSPTPNLTKQINCPFGSAAVSNFFLFFSLPGVCSAGQQHNSLGCHTAVGSNWEGDIVLNTWRKFCPVKGGEALAQVPEKLWLL